jgi:mannonate dehydratase
MNRRQAMQAALAAGPVFGSKVGLRNGKGIKLSEIFYPGETSRLKLAQQIGLKWAIVGVNGELAKVRREQYVEVLTRVKNEFAAHGISIAGVESHPVNAEKIKLGLDGRDDEIENYKWAIEALSKVGVKMVCYNFMAGLGWYRTKVNVPERGGALTSEFNNADALKQGPTKFGEVSGEKMWSNMEHFLKAVIPVAEKHGVQMAAHPDDPPIPNLRGIGRILINAKNYERVMDTVPSPINGVTFCQANFVAMGEDIYALAKKWCSRKKVFFVHYRDIDGKGERFRETVHDNGPTDMVKILKIYSDNGFDGPIRPDHAPTMEGEDNDRPGYAMMGKVLAFGYMKGILESLRLPYE